MTPADLGHMSIRRNPLIADLLHRIDCIEKAGTGIRRIRDGAKVVDCPEPEFRAGSFVTITFRPNPEVGEAPGDGRVTLQVTPEVAGQVRLLRALSGEMTRQGLQEAPGLKHRVHCNEVHLAPALEAGLIEMTIPDKPRSSKQRYRLTPTGCEYPKRIGDAR